MPFEDNDPSLKDLVKTKEVIELMGLPSVAEQILIKRPGYVIVGDAHVNSEPQNIASALLQAIAENSHFTLGDIGFYVEALFDYAQPKEGDFRGAVIKYDDAYWSGNTNYTGTINTALKNRINVHGIDLDKPLIDYEGKERLLRWKEAIESGQEKIKLLLVGAGHLWNDVGRAADLMHLLDKTIWLIENEDAYFPEGYHEMLKIDVQRPDLTKKKYQLVQYYK